MSENPHDFCDRLNTIIQQRQGANETNKFDDELVAIIDKLQEWKCFIKTQLLQFIHF